ncbi:MAG: FecR family protein, partial [Spirochaetaceae bacterium]|nr:FecR family protein [Spirochaetaceae bacterium]
MRDTDHPEEKKLGPGDAVFICLYAAAAAVCLFLFWQDLNLSLTRLDETPSGIVTWKYRAAQRRFSDRILWERLKRESPVYDGDTVRTANMSEATVSLFADGGILTLEENTLIRIQTDRTGTLIDLAEGSVSAAALDRSLRITGGGVTVDAAGGALVSATLPGGGKGLEVQVLEGSAGIRQGGEQRTLTAGEVYSTGARVAVVAPAPQTKFLNQSSGPLAVAFRWNRIGFAPQERVRLDIAEDRSFTRIVESRESEGGEETPYLVNGVYYWRAYPSSEANAEIRTGGVSGKLTLVYAPPPELYRPAQNERFRFYTSWPGIRFQWQALEGPASYLIEVSSSPTLENPLFSAMVQSAGGDTVSIVHSGFSTGSFYWRVTPVYPRDYTGTAQISAVHSFTIDEASELASPQIQGQIETVYLEAQQDSYFTWKVEADAAYYTFLLSRNEDLSDPLIRRQELNNYSAFNAREAGLMPGRYYWGVFQTDMEGNSSALSRTQPLIVMAGAPPERAGNAARPASQDSTPGTPDTPA